MNNHERAWREIPPPDEPIATRATSFGPGAVFHGHEQLVTVQPGHIQSGGIPAPSDAMVTRATLFVVDDVTTLANTSLHVMASG
ncbi:MAG: hypothetical protein ACREJX_08330 [Polyangiaceae bacterium]